MTVTVRDRVTSVVLLCGLSAPLVAVLSDPLLAVGIATAVALAANWGLWRWRRLRAESGH
ncbi:hypothetical protein GCM10010451_68460 [Streptomyces virens]|uniref:Uncharacterized protein n=1 Tax=Streptomyces virens TaxID=285572 RepID=A0ABP6HL75_9ACTN